MCFIYAQEQLLCSAIFPISGILQPYEQADLSQPYDRADSRNYISAYNLPYLAFDVPT